MQNFKKNSDIMGIKSSVDRITNRVTQRVKYFKVGGRNFGDFVSFFVSRIIPAVYIVILFVYSGGIVNALLEGSRPNLRGAIIVPSRAAESAAEGILNASTIAIGTAGIYLLYRGGRQTMRGRLSVSYIFGGIMLLIVSLVIGFTLLRLKGF